MSRRPRARYGGCGEIVARSPVVLEERTSQPMDFTHLQFCNAPRVHGKSRCARHLRKPNSRLEALWQRFVRRGRLA